MYDIANEYDRQGDIERHEEESREESDTLTLIYANETIAAARDFIHKHLNFDPDAPTLEAELNALLKVLRGHDDPEQDTFMPGLPVLADKLAAVIHYSDMPSEDAMLWWWRMQR